MRNKNRLILAPKQTFAIAKIVKICVNIDVYKFVFAGKFKKRAYTSLKDHTISLAFSVWHHYLVEKPRPAPKGLKPAK